MSNIYLKQPQLLTNITEIRQGRRFENGEAAVVLGQNIICPETGGQPCDRATVTVGDRTFQTGRVFKADSQTWISLKSVPELPSAGEMAYVEVDAERRQRLSRYHTLTHLMMAAGRHVVDGFDSKGARIHDNERTVSIAFRACAKPTETQLKVIDAAKRPAGKRVGYLTPVLYQTMGSGSTTYGAAGCTNVQSLTRHFVLKDAPVTFSSVKSPEAGAQRFPKWRIDSELNLSGSIRVVEIRGIDANPCSGSHVGRTGEIVAFAMKTASANGHDVVTLNAEIATEWTYWFGDGFLKDSAGVDLSCFEQ